MDVSNLPDEVVHTTIIKRKKVHKGDEHHGGAWKVAYADFVTRSEEHTSELQSRL